MKTLVQYVSSLLNTATENPCGVFCWLLSAYTAALNKEFLRLKGESIN